MMMMTQRTNRPSPTLFDGIAPAATPEEELRERVRTFSRAVARRHRRSHAGVGEFLTALRGYHRTLAICAETRIPPLDDALAAFATAAYLSVRSAGHRTAA